MTYGVKGDIGVMVSSPFEAELVPVAEKIVLKHAESSLLKDGDIVYKAKNILWRYHCPFGPCGIDINGKELWSVNGETISDRQIKLMKKILEDVTIAPLYINDPIMKYPAQWVLTYGQKRDIEGL